MIYSYLRVSSKDQNLDRQIYAVKVYRPKLKDENIFSDKKSGKDFERKEYQKMKSILRPGDELIIKELDRLGRNKREIKEELEWFKAHKIIVRILDVPTTLIDFKDQQWIFDMVNNILIEVLASVAEEERIKNHERQSEGIAAAKREGIRLGRHKKKIIGLERCHERYLKGEISISQACRELKISRTQWYRIFNNKERCA